MNKLIELLNYLSEMRHLFLHSTRERWHL